MALLSPLACGNLIGLGEYRADPDGSADDNAGDNGSGGSASSAGKCVNDVAGTDVDTGCTVTSPMCDVGNDRCGECIKDSDCNQSCAYVSVSCDDGACKVTASVEGLALMDGANLNGSFEEATVVDATVSWDRATGWTEEGYFSDTGSGYTQTRITLNGNDVFCNKLPEDEGILASDGNRMACLGGTVHTFDAANTAEIEGPDGWLDRLTSPLFTIPVGTATIQLRADTNFVSDETAGLSNEYDTYDFKLLDSDGGEVLLTHGSQKDCFPYDPNWKSDGIDEIVAIPSTWIGKKVRLEISAINDTTKATAFTFDRIRLSAEVSCD